MKLLRAAIYRRVSQEEHEAKDSDIVKQSLNNQLKSGMEDIERMGWEFAKDYNDGFVSGTEINRKEFNQMWQDAKDDKMDIIWCRDYSRLSRDPAQIAQFWQDIKALGKRIYCHQEGWIHGDAQQMMMAFTSAEAIRIGRHHQSEMMKRKAKEGLPFGAPPFGYRRVIIDGQKTWEVDEEKAKLVREIFHEYLEGQYRYVDIAAKFGIERNSLKYMLRNKSYTGLLDYTEKFKGSEGKVLRTEKHEYQAKIPIIIQKRVFDKVQEKIKTHTHKSLLDQIAEQSQNPSDNSKAHI